MSTYKLSLTARERCRCALKIDIRAMDRGDWDKSERAWGVYLRLSQMAEITHLRWMGEHGKLPQ